MRETSKDGVFGPTDLLSISTAYDAALEELSGAGDALADVPARDLRRRLASCILLVARTGERNPVALRQLAVAAMTRRALRPT